MDPLIPFSVTAEPLGTPNQQLKFIKKRIETKVVHDTDYSNAYQWIAHGVAAWTLDEYEKTPSKVTQNLIRSCPQGIQFK